MQELQYETFTRSGLLFELRGVRGDWGLHAVDPHMFKDSIGWDGYINHYPTKKDAIWFAARFAEENKAHGIIQEDV